MMDLGLTDKVALITGGIRGLGRAIAEKLAAEKVKIVVTGTNEERAKKQQMKYHQLMVLKPWV